MRGREWKPGDVAIKDGERAFLVERHDFGCALHHPKSPHRHYASGDWDPVDADEMRPVVVIDPEDREQVERLYRGMWSTNAVIDMPEPGSSDYESDIEDVTAALRSLLAPPKPDEPQGRYAVVEDDKAVEWVRAELVGVAQWHSIEGDRSRWSSYDDIAAVKVLSEGVTA